MEPGKLSITMRYNLFTSNYSISAIQERNLELLQAKLYQGQDNYDPTTANVRYEFLPSDSSSLYKRLSRHYGINVQERPQYNIDNWLNPQSPFYKPEIAQAIFHYKGRLAIDPASRLEICIQNEEMKKAAWKYSHQKQLILDGTFGICDSRVLLFIALGVDENNKGVPLAFFLFSAPTGNQATHAGYDTFILNSLLNQWSDSLGTRQGLTFKPLVAITDTDTTECGALTMTWPGIWLILCHFHIRQCWTNHRKKLLKVGQNLDFPKLQVHSRLKDLEEKYVIYYNSFRCPQPL